MQLNDSAILETKAGKFELRCLKPEDVSEEYLKWFSDDSVIRYISYKDDSLNLSRLKEYVAEKKLSEDSVLFGIFSKPNGKHVGNVKFEPIDAQSNSTVVGILIGQESSRGLGLAGMAISAGIDILRRHYDFDFIIVRLGVSLENKSAIKAYSKIGFSITEFPELNVEEGAVVMEKHFEF